MRRNSIIVRQSITSFIRQRTVNEFGMWMDGAEELSVILQEESVSIDIRIFDSHVSSSIREIRIEGTTKMEGSKSMEGIIQNAREYHFLCLLNCNWKGVKSPVDYQRGSQEEIFENREAPGQLARVIPSVISSSSLSYHWLISYHLSVMVYTFVLVVHPSTKEEICSISRRLNKHFSMLTPNLPMYALIIQYLDFKKLIMKWNIKNDVIWGEVDLRSHWSLHSRSTCNHHWCTNDRSEYVQHLIMVFRRKWTNERCNSNVTIDCLSWWSLIWLSWTNRRSSPFLCVCHSFNFNLFFSSIATFSPLENGIACPRERERESKGVEGEGTMLSPFHRSQIEGKIQEIG